MTWIARISYFNTMLNDAFEPLATNLYPTDSLCCLNRIRNPGTNITLSCNLTLCVHGGATFIETHMCMWVYAAGMAIAITMGNLGLLLFIGRNSGGAKSVSSNLPSEVREQFRESSETMREFAHD